MTWTPHENKPLLVRFSEWLVEPDEWPAWVQFFLLPKPLGRENFFFVRVVLLIAMAFFSVQAFFKGYESWIAQFLHNLNLPVHETGHIVFGIFGKPLITSLGGSLFQTIMPFIPLYFAVITGLQHYAVVKSFYKDPRTFVKNFLGLTVGTLFLHLVVICTWSLTHIPEARTFILAFCICYIAYLTFETIALILLIKQQRKQQK